MNLILNNIPFESELTEVNKSSSAKHSCIFVEPSYNGDCEIHVETDAGVNIILLKLSKEHKAQLIEKLNNC